MFSSHLPCDALSYSFSHLNLCPPACNSRLGWSDLIWLQVTTKNIYLDWLLGERTAVTWGWKQFGAVFTIRDNGETIRRIINHREINRRWKWQRYRGGYREWYKWIHFGSVSGNDINYIRDVRLKGRKNYFLVRFLHDWLVTLSNPDSNKVITEWCPQFILLFARFFKKVKHCFICCFFNE